MISRGKVVFLIDLNIRSKILLGSFRKFVRYKFHKTNRIHICFITKGSMDCEIN